MDATEEKNRNARFAAAQVEIWCDQLRTQDQIEKLRAQLRNIERALDELCEDADRKAERYMRRLYEQYPDKKPEEE